MDWLRMTPPKSDEVRLVFFGPGYGESILVHVGNGIWVIVDSCLDDSRQPAALGYLRSIGVDPSVAVKAIIASHWHDDHIKGMAAQLEVCQSASFTLSSALQNKEFVAFLVAHDNQPETKLDLGGTEMLKCLRLLRSAKRQPRYAGVDRLVCVWEDGTLAHGQRVELLALSPSDAMYTDFMIRIGSLLSGGLTGKPKKRLVDPGKNDLSIATLLTVGQSAILLGADVEEHGKTAYGWSNIVECRRGRNPKAKLYKVAHHGSIGAHLDEIWSEILIDGPLSVITPWRLGGNQLPTADDVARICERSESVFLTGSQAESPKKRYERDVLKLVDHANVNLRSNILKSGHVSVTLNGATGETAVVEIHGGAKKL
ncbi:MBL fold metallo-hydrolase [Cereibacter sphaeroides]|uniref:MBL fold metallo-hydrolase n=1 Tax=Cereibacter sphaeroides TaxID=1063 RepID=UPI001F485318|nr:MBL fold metallo-hydrolase [Cereibacter sphaeroides]MCE6957599.1 MBL fold metallo-hydrolase [Cereibacter sphaeroides]MCE6971115.1 MBL fold metallo-hydrolase [Cereibacter sphaeroides]